MNRQILWAIILGGLVAVPIGIYLTRAWLNGFAYHTNLGILTVVGALLIITILGVGIVSLLSFRVANASPVNYLQE